MSFISLAAGRTARKLSSSVPTTAHQQRRGMAFARILSAKVPSKDIGFAVDEVVKEKIVPELKSRPGFLGASRYLCGNELDYKLTTHWDSVDNLVGFTDNDTTVVETLANTGQVKPEEVHLQVRVALSQPFSPEQLLASSTLIVHSPS